MRKQKAVIRLSSASGTTGVMTWSRARCIRSSLTPMLRKKVTSASLTSRERTTCYPADYFVPNRVADRCGQGPSGARLTPRSSGRPNVVLCTGSVVFVTRLDSCRPPLSAIVGRLVIKCSQVFAKTVKRDMLIKR